MFFLIYRGELGENGDLECSTGILGGEPGVWLTLDALCCINGLCDIKPPCICGEGNCWPNGNGGVCCNIGDAGNNSLGCWWSLDGEW